MTIRVIREAKRGVRGRADVPPWNRWKKPGSCGILPLDPGVLSFGGVWLAPAHVGDVWFPPTHVGGVWLAPTHVGGELLHFSGGAASQSTTRTWGCLQASNIARLQRWLTWRNWVVLLVSKEPKTRGVSIQPSYRLVRCIGKFSLRYCLASLTASCAPNPLNSKGLCPFTPKPLP